MICPTWSALDQNRRAAIASRATGVADRGSPPTRGGAKAATEQRSKQLAAMLDAGGFTRPDDGSDEMIPYADDAYMYLLMVKKVPDTEASRVVEARWPSVAAYEFDDDEFY